MAALILPVTIAAWAWVYAQRVPVRPAILRSMVTFAAAAVLTAELVSLLHALDRATVAMSWLAVLGVPLVILLRTPVRAWSLSRPSLFDLACIAGIVMIACTTLRVALLSPPNSADAMSYHLPRIVHWVQNRSVAFFPTAYLNEIMLQPVAEYLMLHAYLLSGGDRFTNLVQFGAYAGSVIGVSSIAEGLGLSPRGQVISAVFCATLPNAILQASGAKNDCVLSLWLVCSVLFGIRYLQNRSTPELVFLSLSAGLALGTKGTAYLFLPPSLLAAGLATGKLAALSGRDSGKAALVLCAGVLLINGPQYVRNYDLSGSILGFDSAQGDGLFRWRNENPGWKSAVSNALRNLSEQLGARSEAWNRNVYTLVLSIHDALGLDPQDPGTTWRWAEFRPPRNTNHEADANNRVHLLLFGLAAAVAGYRAFRYGDKSWFLYCLGLVTAFAVFCFYLKWQPFFSRIETPLFVLMAPAAAMALGRLRPAILPLAVCLVLLSNSRLAVTQNWTRPLTGQANLRSAPRQLSYFNDMGQWNNRTSYLEAVERAVAARCRLIGVDNGLNHLEYPFQALILEKDREVRFTHVGVENPSAKYARPQDAKPCAILCADCAGVPEKAVRYSAMGESQTIGRFLLFVRERD